MPRRLHLAVASAALVMGLCASAVAQGASKGPVKGASKGPVKGEVLVVLASEQAGEIDKSLKAIRALRKPPFSSFKSMKVLSRQDITIDDKKPVTTKLPNGRLLQLELLERMPDGRHKVQVSINRPSKKDYLPLLTVIASAEPFFVAGQKHAGGTLVIGVRVFPKPKPAEPESK